MVEIKGKYTPQYIVVRQTAFSYILYIYYFSNILVTLHFLFLRLFFTLSTILRTAKVIAIHSDIKGVNGASQNAQQADPTPHHHLFPVIIAKRYGIHTSDDNTKKTMTKIRIFVLSFNCLKPHFIKALNLVHSFFIRRTRYI